ncbi:MAG: metal-sensitive transcriptional regulator [Candidatus Omnitrophica bacterium]|nr:metal-sensitive transcriptional regulator [Candidatus Omnitrophota bacterium]
MKQKTAHQEQLPALRRIEGQVKGIQRMIENKQYCIDIIIQLHAAINALYRVSDRIFAKHIAGCVQDAFNKRDKAEKNKKIKEIIGVINMLHKLD